MLARALLIVTICAFAVQGCDSAAAINRLADNIVDASTKLDPLAIKQILKDNKDLDSRNKALEAAIARMSQTKGVVNLRDGGAFLQVASAAGTFELHVFLDDQKTPIAKLIHTDEGRFGDDGHWVDSIENPTREIRIDEALKSVGHHVVRFEIKDERGRGWHFTLNLHRKRDGGAQEENVIVQTYSNSDFGQARLDTAYNQMTAFDFNVIFVEPSPGAGAAS